MCNAGPITQCTDALIVLGDTLVLIERFTFPRGLALPGGKVENDETPAQAVLREVREETGLVFVPHGIVGVYDAPARDARGRYISTVFHGEAHGVIREERGKTCVRLMRCSDALRQADAFVADHATIIADYLHMLRGV